MTEPTVPDLVVEYLQRIHYPVTLKKTPSAANADAWTQSIKGNSLSKIDFEPTLQSLAELMEHQLFTVPFENLDIYMGKYVKVKPEAGFTPSGIPAGFNSIDNLFDKIVHATRGGFCFELNATFCWLLRELGFEAHLIAARVSWSGPSGFFPKRTHAMILVDLDGKTYIVDVGFAGKTVGKPIFFNPDFDVHVQVIPFAYTSQSVRIRKDGDRHFLGWFYEHPPKKAKDDVDPATYEPNWNEHLELQLGAPWTVEEFKDALDWVQTDPQSFHMKGRCAVLFRPTSRVLILFEQFIVETAMTGPKAGWMVTSGEHTESHAIEDDAWPALLATEFHITLEHPEKLQRVPPPRRDWLTIGATAAAVAAVAVVGVVKLLRQ